MVQINKQLGALSGHGVRNRGEKTAPGVADRPAGTETAADNQRQRDAREVVQSGEIMGVDISDSLLQQLHNLMGEESVYIEY